MLGITLNHNCSKCIQLGKRRTATIREVYTNNYLDKFDMIRGDLTISNAIMKCIQFFIDVDINYLRENVLKLPPLTQELVDEIRYLQVYTPTINAQDQGDVVQDIDSVELPTPSSQTV